MGVTYAGYKQLRSLSIDGRFLHGSGYWRTIDRLERDGYLAREQVSGTTYQFVLTPLALTYLATLHGEQAREGGE